mmetsp:Transcript_119/g.334  ORF Transcript_119/g.334 Transcript_119/m.334 type:complete len:432 (+) Transcript_119:66-1361(+)
MPESDSEDAKTGEEEESINLTGQTLQAAARLGNTRLVQLLLAAGADVNDVSAGQTPLYCAAVAGHVPVACQLLRARADVDEASFESSCARLERTGCQQHIFPTIDISPFVSPGNKEDDKLRKQTAQVWDEVFRTTGFGVISGHDVGRDVIEGLVQGIRRFFARSHEYKMQYNNGPILSNKSGYAPIGGAPDPFEGYTLVRRHGARWSSGERHPPELGAVLEKYAYAVERVMHAVNRMSAVALDMDMLYFDQFYRSPASVLVVNYYPSPDSLRGKGYESLEKRRRRYRPHSDYTGFTILLQDSGDHNDGSGGLEIDIADSWVPVHPREHCFVVNIGDYFENWTNARWRSTPHRVTAPELGSAANARPRISVALFTGPDLDAIVEPIPTCVNAKNPPLFKPAPARDLLVSNATTRSKEAIYEMQEAMEARRAG